MNCPNDSSVLVMSERNGVEIDYCPQCRGVWLDRGELDKILERAEREFTSPTAAVPIPPAAPVAYPQQPRYDDRDYGRGYDNRYPKKRRESWLSELFD